jgi:hypothetical protein
MKETIIEANRLTYLKRSPQQANILDDNDKVRIAKGKTYWIDERLEVRGLHECLRISGSGNQPLGIWWVFRPHWDYHESLPVIARFSLKQPQKGIKDYVWGELSFSDGFGIQASSGQPGYQYKGAHKIRGLGLIPESEDWGINLPGYHLNTRGIEGHFWHITPDPYMGRGELGIHKDANFLGTGCIVVPTNLFPRLETYLKDKAKTIKQIKLTVRYGS